MQSRRQTSELFSATEMAQSGGERAEALAANNSISATPQVRTTKQRATVSLACELCRKRRSKCVVEAEGGECQVCLASGVPCVFTGVDRRKDNLRTTRSRLNYLEDCMRRLRCCPSTEVQNVLRDMEPGSADEDITRHDAPRSSALSQFTLSDTARKRSRHASSLPLDSGSSLASSSSYVPAVAPSFDLNSSDPFEPEIAAAGPASNFSSVVDKYVHIKRLLNFDGYSHCDYPMIQADGRREWSHLGACSCVQFCAGREP